MQINRFPSEIDFHCQLNFNANSAYKVKLSFWSLSIPAEIKVYKGCHLVRPNFEQGVEMFRANDAEIQKLTKVTGLRDTSCKGTSLAVRLVRPNGIFSCNGTSVAVRLGGQTVWEMQVVREHRLLLDLFGQMVSLVIACC